MGHRRRALCVLGSGWLSGVLACGGDALVVAEAMGRVGVGGVAGNGPAVVADAGGNEAVAMPLACPPSPAERQALFGCWPTRHLGRWRGFFIGNPSYEIVDGSRREFPLGDLVLTLDPGGSGSLTFGATRATAPPVAAGDAYLCAGTLPVTGCPAAQQIIEGFVYSLEQIELLDPDVESSPRIGGELPLQVGERLYFGIPLDQPWRGWCELQQPERYECACRECGRNTPECYRFGPAPETVDLDSCEVRDGADRRAVDCGWLSALRDVPCKCGPEGCEASGPSLGISLQMSEDGRALRGAYLPVAANQRPGHLEFLRESMP